jgi:hypothetical protein
MRREAGTSIKAEAARQVDAAAPRRQTPPGAAPDRSHLAERSRLLMDVSIDAVNTLASGSIFHDLRPEPSKS